MLYMVTTKRGEPFSSEIAEAQYIVSRRVVATLDEARRAAGRACLGSTPLNLDNIEQARMLPELGGTVGPLPDGTVIEVEQVSWQFIWSESRLASRALLRRAIDGDETAQQTILDAFNARFANAQTE